MSNRKPRISVTDLASYAADPCEFIKYKKQGLTEKQKQIGDSFHEGLHKKNNFSSKLTILILLAIMVYLLA